MKRWHKTGVNHGTRSFLFAGIFLAMTAHAIAASCVFPADATSATGEYAFGHTQEDAAIDYWLKITLGPNTLDALLTGDPDKILAMYPPSIWEPANEDAIKAALTRAHPGIPIERLYTPRLQDPAATIGCLRYKTEVGIHWYVGTSGLNAPSLGGLLAYGPTSCSISTPTPVPRH